MTPTEDYRRSKAVIVLLAAVSALLLVGVGWLWELLDAAGRTLLVVGWSVALFAFGCFMDWITGRSKKSAADRR